MRLISNLLLFIFLATNAFALDEFINIVKIENDISNIVHSKISHLVEKEDVIVSVQVEKKQEVKKSTKKKDYAKKYSPLTKFNLLDEFNFEEIETPNAPKFEVEKVNVLILLKKQLEKSVKDDIKTILEKSLNKIGRFDASYKFDTFEKKPKKVAAEKEVPFYKKYANLIAAVTLGIFAILISLLGINKFQKVGMSLISALEGLKPEPEESASGDMGADDANADGNESTLIQLGESSPIEIMVAESEGVKRFTAFIKEDAESAANLIRSWKVDGSSLASSSISISLRSLDFSMLMEFMNNFTAEEKADLQESMVKLEIKDSAVDIDDFIKDHLIKLILKPSLVQDKSFNRLLFSTKTEQFIKIAEDNTVLGSILLALLPENITSDICVGLEPEVFKNVMNESISFSNEKLHENLEDLRSALSEINSSDQRFVSPFFDNTTAILQSADDVKEKTIIDALVKTKDQDEVQSILLNTYPRELISSLPEEVVKSSLLSLRKEFVSFLALQEEEDRTKYLNIVSQEGSKSRDIYNLELKKLLENQEQLDKIISNREKIFNNYIKAIRKTVTSAKYKIAANSILEIWLKSQYENSPELKIAS